MKNSKEIKESKTLIMEFIKDHEAEKKLTENQILFLTFSLLIESSTDKFPGTIHLCDLMEVNSVTGLKITGQLLLKGYLKFNICTGKLEHTGLMKRLLYGMIDVKRQENQDDMLIESGCEQC